MIIARYAPALTAIVALFGAIPGRADDVLPPNFNFDRYLAMVDHSPFAIATAVASPAATPDFARDFYVANAAQSPEGDMVTIASSSDQNFKKYLTTRDPVDGYSIAGIEWSDRVGATTVTISKDGKFATLTFNQALLSQRPSPNAPLAPDSMLQSASLKPRSVPQQVPAVHGMNKLHSKAPSVPTANSQTSNSEQQERLQSRLLKEQILKRKANTERP
jgi:hypothetical protein